DQILFAPARPGNALPARARPIDAALTRFATDISPHLVDPNHFPSTAPVRYAVIRFYEIYCNYLGYSTWPEVNDFWPCFVSVSYAYIAYRDYSVYDADAIFVASKDFQMIHGYEPRSSGLDAIEGKLQDVLDIEIGGWNSDELFSDGAVVDEAIRRGIELFVVLAGIADAAAQDGPEGDDQASANVDRVLLKGRRVLGYGPFHTVLEYRGSTISAFDTDDRAFVDGTLLSEVDWPRDRPHLTMQLGAVDGPAPAAAYWASLLAADARYDDDLPYDLFPSLGFGGYNSNSYVAGIINATAGIPTRPMSSFVGGERPVPLAEFN
ncbi:MAG: hypothetical protein R3305_11060, partial [Gammaproteobacteria bacterium]|nr:hypothetical protein [Gammaproteobacteria bacterium]